MRLYYHKTSGGAEYLMNKFIKCPNGDKEGRIAGSTIIVRIDGNLEKDAEIFLKGAYSAAPNLLEAAKVGLKLYETYGLLAQPTDSPVSPGQWANMTRDAIAKAEGRDA